ncbi:proline-rich protein 29-like [Erpetoichthys calabaricus]|uniref:proline-rich protein 29-like n=1 Tax=Erpetoichthys calabaricus TaxID=27687 RepID=UPI002234CE72|nr:proline-rich protein 29-like [Erpetoichthys calabaricus]
MAFGGQQGEWWRSDAEVPQQPTTIIQQFPPAMPPAVYPFRPGQVKEDLLELMMLQNAQMHQLIMNNMTMSALHSFGYTAAPPVEPPRVPVIIEEEPEPVYHHHYQPVPFPAYPAWQQPWRPAKTQPEAAVRHMNQDSPATTNRDRKAVPPPPPPSATRTVGADIPPASEYYDVTEGRL